MKPTTALTRARMLQERLGNQQNQVTLLRMQQGAIIDNQRVASSTDGSTSLLVRAKSPGGALDRSDVSLRTLVSEISRGR